jgi:hypothetical protein
MYSPKIREDYIPVLYRIARNRGVPMTRLVCEALDEYLKKTGTTSPDVHRKEENSGHKQEQRDLRGRT